MIQRFKRGSKSKISRVENEPILRACHKRGDKPGKGQVGAGKREYIQSRTLVHENGNDNLQR